MVIDYALVERELRSVIEESPLVDDDVLRLIRESVSAGEMSLAFDTLCSWIVDDDLPVSADFYARVQDLSEVLGASRLVSLMAGLVSG